MVQCPLADLALGQGCGGVLLHPGSPKDKARALSKPEEHCDPGSEGHHCLFHLLCRSPGSQH